MTFLYHFEFWKPIRLMIMIIAWLFVRTSLGVNSIVLLFEERPFKPTMLADNPLHNFMSANWVKDNNITDDLNRLLVWPFNKIQIRYSYETKIYTFWFGTRIDTSTVWESNYIVVLSTTHNEISDCSKAIQLVS